MKTISISRFFTLLLLFAVCSASAQKISKAERKILKTIEANNAEAIQFLKDVVNINSGTMNHDGVKKVGDSFAKAFNEIGFATSWYDMS
ncbi:MAG: M20 family peptidase, partial [Flavobacteriaceae bacterium]|nr:M20 family peptidase [Flavobacteriaceae bacterium]